MVSEKGSTLTVANCQEKRGHGNSGCAVGGGGSGSCGG
jgi:hypothetical protein